MESTARCNLPVIENPFKKIKGCLWLVRWDHVPSIEYNKDRQVGMPSHKSCRLPAFGTKGINWLRLGCLDLCEPLPAQLWQPSLQPQSRAYKVQLPVIDCNRKACSFKPLFISLCSSPARLFHEACNPSNSVLAKCNLDASDADKVIPNPSMNSTPRQGQISAS